MGKDIDNELEECNIYNRDISETTLKKNAIKVLRDYQSKKGEFKTWTVTEDAVRTRTAKYSIIVLTVAIGIIGGNLTVPFLVKKGIPGVDPFQFVTFGWLLAGAFLVLAKSRYVENWPWHDFLRGQMVCRSVSELAVASRVKEQAVLLYLLHHEFRNPLVYCGPYPGVFRRRAEKGARGFDINVPTGHATVLAAGFIVHQFRAKDAGEHTDTTEREWKVYTELQDTREDAPGTPLVFNQYEGLEGGADRQKPGSRATRLKLDENPSINRLEREILGLPTTDYLFI
jgi:hypothetical protein